MPYPLPLTRTEAYLAYKAGVIQQSDLKPSLAVPRNGIDAWLAYWTGLAADYPKREDGTPHILQEEEAYIAYLCGVINEYPEKCLRRVGAYLRYLISARWGRPDHPLNREELYLSLIKTQFIPSGDPSSDIEIDGTAKAAFQDVKMYGDTFQQSYTGKNLLNLSAPRGAISGTDYNFDVSSGVLTVTKASAPAVNRYSGWYVTGLTPGAKYTFSIESFTNPALSNTDRAMMIRSYNGTSASELATLDKTQTSYTSTVPNDSVRLEFFFYIASGDTDSTSIITKPMLEAGETATTYEPFVGGQASPSPDYPQPIRTVTGEQTVTVEGKNKYPFSDVKWSTTATSTGWRYQDGADNAYGANMVDRTNYKLTLPAGSYTITVYNIDSNIISIQACTNGTGSEVIITYPYNLSSTNPSSTITLTEPTAFCLRYRVTNPSLGIGNTKIQIEKGSTATAYEPYISNDYEINLGKNLYDGSVFKVDQILSSNGGEVYSPGAVITEQIKIEPNTVYTASAIWNSSGGGDTYIRIGVYDASMGWIVRYSGQLDKITFTTPANARYIRLSYYRSRTDSVQLELGSTPTTYAPYFDPIELNNLDDTYLDYIYKDGEDWKVHKAVSSITLNGTEGWVYADNYNYARCPSYIFVNKPLGGTGVGLQLSNYFRVITDWGTFRDSTSRNAFFPLLDEGYKISIRNTGCTSAESYKSWLSANKPSFYYPVETPTDTVIANQNLIDQLNALKNGGAENGTTYIKVNATDPNLPGLLYVEAPKYE